MFSNYAGKFLKSEVILIEICKNEAVSSISLHWAPKDSYVEIP